MALHEIRSGMDAMSPVEGTSPRRKVGTVNWGSIFVGAFVGLAFSVLFSLLATAVFIGGINLVLPTPDVTVGEAIYGILMVGISLGIAGYVVARIGRFEDARTAALHGLAAWAIGAPVLVLAGALLTNLFIFATAGLVWTMFLAYLCGALASMAGAVFGIRRSRERMSYRRTEEERLSTENRAA